MLVEKGVAHVVDDVMAHKEGFLRGGLSAEERRAYHASLRKQGQAAASHAVKKTEDRKRAALSKKAEAGDSNDVSEEKLQPSSSTALNTKLQGNDEHVQQRQFAHESIDEEEPLFPSTMNSVSTRLAGHSRISSVANKAGPEPYAVTPTTSYPPLEAHGPPGEDVSELPNVGVSYPLFKHMHENEYFLAPGLRFGCQYMAYPGDPLRFHSHFLCNGMGWDQEFDLLDLVGGGRLGTGVKKGFLIGGEERAALDAPKSQPFKTKDVAESNVRAFCIEWGGM